MKARVVFLLIAGLLGLVFLLFGAERTWFLLHSQKATAEVTALDSRNSRCGGRRTRHECTVFTATAHFDTDHGGATIRLTAGEARGHDEPVAKARYHVGEGVPVLYDPDRPDKAVRDTFWDLWAVPLITGAGSFLLLLRGLFTRD